MAPVIRSYGPETLLDVAQGASSAGLLHLLPRFRQLTFSARAHSLSALDVEAGCATIRLVSPATANEPPVPFATESHVYKYSSLSHPEWLKKLLLEHVLYVPTIAELNDPIDGRPFLAPMSKDEMLNFLVYNNMKKTRSSSELQNLIRKLEHKIEWQGTERLMRQIFEKLNAVQEGNRIYSLSKRYDNMGLWSKYAGDHTGYCLEFARKGNFFSRAVEVQYGESVPLDVYNPKSYFLWHKREDWRGEEEVRVIVFQEESETLPFEPLEPPHLLTRIILGRKITHEHEALIRGWATERKPELVVRKTRLDVLSQRLALE